MSANSHKSTMGVLAHGTCMCTVLLKLAKVERLKIRKFWVHVLIITEGWKAAIDCDLPHLDSVHDFYTLMVVSANF